LDNSFFFPLFLLPLNPHYNISFNPLPLFSRNGFNWVSLFDSKATNSSMTPFSLINLGSSFLFHYIYYNGSNYMANTRKVSLSSTELEIMPITAPTNGTTTKWFIRGR